MHRKDFFMKEFIYGVMIAFMFINVGSISLRPLFELATNLKLNNSLWGVIFISAGGAQATNIFLVRGYMNSIPKELDEAAKIDGCTFFQIYWIDYSSSVKTSIGNNSIVIFQFCME